MKRPLFFIILFTVTSIVSMAKSRKIVIYKPPIKQEHEVRLGYSPISLSDARNNIRSAQITPGHYTTEKWQSTGISSATYTYRVNRDLEVGGAFAFSGHYVKRYNIDERIGEYNETYFTISPTLRLTWYEGTSIRAYSSFSIGFGVLIREDNTDIVKDKSSRFAFVGHISPIGLSFGKKFIFFLEPLCFGSQGVAVIAGVGYRFPAR